ncbi:thioredoxin reductase [Anopheles sinensis]|uniref:Thioredoxin reductase n=1 Tax=Anopheles sinensis TaxID=74873 RepID=A0A084VYT7_ANOSI|nr:thioredoxin reductase [Anopheles sinensis]
MYVSIYSSSSAPVTVGRKLPSHCPTVQRRKRQALLKAPQFVQRWRMFERVTFTVGPVADRPLAGPKSPTTWPVFGG